LREVKLFSHPPGAKPRRKLAKPAAVLTLLVLAACLGFLVNLPAAAQIENVDSPQEQIYWVNHGRAEGHLALGYSPAGAFAPDSSVLAVANGAQVVLMNLKSQGIQKLLHPGIARVVDFEIDSASFLAPGEIFVLGAGKIQTKSKDDAPPTPELAFVWNVARDTLQGKIHGVSPEKGFGPARWFPDIGYMGVSKQNIFELWDPVTGKGGTITISSLTRAAGIYALSPNGRWMLLGQIEASSKGDPIVVDRTDDQFVNVLKGHQGAVLSIAFSRDSSKVVTASEDGKVRIFSTAGWGLVHTLEGHEGPVRWAEFSPNGKWVASAGDDKTVRVWSAESGELMQVLRESQAPVLTVAFSPNNDFIAATTAESVQVWRRTTGAL
jgi:WD40 repeat protein